MRRLRSIAMAILLAVAPTVPGAATGPTEQLKASTDRVLQILDDPAFKPEAKVAERRKAVRRIADEIFDFEEMAQRALGQHWRPLTADQRKEFIPLFADLLDRAYMSTIERYNGEPIQYTGERAKGISPSCPPRSSPSRTRKSQSPTACSAMVTGGSSMTSAPRV
jgi:phospholipid transport system substrate-binding protein